MQKQTSTETDHQDKQAGSPYTCLQCCGTTLKRHGQISVKTKIVSVISTELTFIVAGLMFAWIVEEWVWDYAITITLIHIGLTIGGCGLLMMIFGGQLLAYKLFRNNFVYPAELQNF
ncbi:hypothetical protein JZ751_005041 [Albula glossodonta]|uniref:Uncharacterized protein n=1 Tax=Albula glossodonta TaxID=121402 RepID=A0A8T2P4M8_9TELE|nr:hypothetical protein JZ751_005041 [Albula glossodonta]